MSCVFFFKQKTAYEMRISDWSSDVCSSDLADGTHTIIAVDETTRIKASGGFLGLSRSKLGAESLLNGLPVSVETLQWDGGLVAREIDLKNKDLKTAAMIRSGTRSEEHTSELQSLMRISYAVFCLKKKNRSQKKHIYTDSHNTPNDQSM